MEFVSPMPFGEAVRKIGTRSPIGSVLSSAEWSDVPVALRERAFFSSQVENVRFLGRLQDWIGDFLSANREMTESGLEALKVGSRADFVDLAREFALKEGMGPLVPEDAGGLKDITSEQRLGLIFNTQTRQANDYGYWRQGMDKDVLNEFPAQRFIRVQAVKEERESHARFEGQVFLKTDPIWANVINEDFGVPWGPWAWGCGHDVEDVDRGEAEDLGLIKPGQEIEPDRKNFNENLEASASGIEPELLDKLKSVFGKQLVIEGDRMKWGQSLTGQKQTPHPGPLTAPVGPSGEGELPAALPGESEVSPAMGPTAGEEENQSPVSDALDVRIKGSGGERVRAAIAAIDQVHDDGDLPEIPVVGKTSKGALGQIVWTKVRAGLATTYEAKEIGIKRTGHWPGLTMVHEVGHFLDMLAIGRSPTGQVLSGQFATMAGDAAMKEVLKAAEETESIKGLRLALENSQSIARRQMFKYMLQPYEIWARAYAQFVAERSGNKLLLADLAKSIELDKLRQWGTEDFAPVAKAIEKMFNQLGWM